MIIFMVLGGVRLDFLGDVFPYRSNKCRVSSDLGLAFFSIRFSSLNRRSWLSPWGLGFRVIAFWHCDY